MEYGLDPQLTLYSGGLGILAGDYMKAAGDSQAPILGIGLLWNQGYCRQRVNERGEVYSEYTLTDRSALTPVDVRFDISIAGETVACTAYRVQRYTQAQLYLLEPVLEKHQWITQRLYGGGGKDRVAQEILLGVGGVRLIRALGAEIDIYHFNEGHAVFAGLELIRERMEQGEDFPTAWQQVRKEIVFTTHTPVPAGNECHEHELIESMGANLSISRKHLQSLGGNPFSMTVAGLRLATRANAVAKIHADTARSMWAHVEDSAPIMAITNGVHRQTWQDATIAASATNSDALWKSHQVLKNQLVQRVKALTDIELNVEAPLIGFARRAATYKRSNLVLGDPHRLEQLFEKHNLQFVFSGKAHPQDTAGRQTVETLIRAAQKWPKHIVFISDYDMAIGALLTRGCDVWLNNPRKPMEACGTSGMKAAMNGVLNLSIADGWWPEGARQGETGWTIQPPEPVSDQDEADRTALYKLLEMEVLPCYKDRPRWVQMMQNSIKMATYEFSSERMLKEYFKKLY